MPIVSFLVLVPARPLSGERSPRFYEYRSQGVHRRLGNEYILCSIKFQVAIATPSSPAKHDGRVRPCYRDYLGSLSPTLFRKVAARTLSVPDPVVR